MSIASHIKPYKLSNKDEKYDLENVLLLSATFDKDNYLVFSDILPPTDIFKLKRDIVHYHLEFSEKQKEYIAFHRERVFRMVNSILSYKTHCE